MLSIMAQSANHAGLAVVLPVLAKIRNTRMKLTITVMRPTLNRQASRSLSANDLCSDRNICRGIVRTDSDQILALSFRVYHSPKTSVSTSKPNDIYRLMA